MNCPACSAQITRLQPRLAFLTGFTHGSIGCLLHGLKQRPGDLLSPAEVMAKVFESFCVDCQSELKAQMASVLKESTEPREGETP